MTQTRAEAVEALAAARPCTDAAVRRLEVLASGKPSAAVLSDLAAAYYVRAQRNDHPSDFVRALDAAGRAVKLAPRSEPARFNQALALEALGFDDDAISAWDDLRRGDGDGWAAEAAEHSQRLSRRRAQRLATQWDDRRLQDAARAGDRAAIAQLIGPYPAATLRYLYESVLPAWASARDDKESRRQLRLAETIAAQLARGTGDRCMLDGVEQIESAKPAQRIAAIRKGILALSEGCPSDAEASFAKAGSPFRFFLTLSRASSLQEMQTTERALALLDVIQREAKQNHYRYLAAVVHIRRGYFRFLQSRYLDSLAEYDAAEALCTRMHDEDDLGIVHTRKLDDLHILGQKDLTWREAFQARRYELHISDPGQRQLLLGELALAAVALGCPEVALRYQNAAIGMIQEKLGRGGDPQRFRGLLGVALGHRAAIYGRLGDSRAIEDLNEALRLVASDSDNELALAMRLAQLRETEGRLLLHSNPSAAVAAFTKAYALASPVYYRTYTASLLVERAEAWLLSGQRAAAETDLQSAIAEFRREERGMLQRRERGGDEPLWSPYFSRSRDAYSRLIRQLSEDGQNGSAFNYGEQGRAFELLNLVRTWTKTSDPLDLPHVQAALPPGTFVVEYWVLGDRTYAWLIGRDDFVPFPLTVGNDLIAAWTASIVQSVTHQREDLLKETLAAASAALVREPLTRIAAIARTRKIRAVKVIFVPDAAMHGLPFAALSDPSNPKQYLIRRYAVAVAPSASLYAYSLSRDAQLEPSAHPTVMLVADPAFDRRLDVAHGLSRLDSARAEVDDIGDAYRPVAKVVPLRGVHATVPAFLARVPESAVIHFAGHGIANPDVPSQSLLLFTPSRGDTGVLDAEELIAKLHSDRTRVVVLSACSTAGGVPVGAEGLAPLVRPILAAGIPAAVGSLWNVKDSDETRELLVRFHKHYRDGYDADAALQLAQLDMLNHPARLFHSPAAWASFQVIGYASSPFRAEKRGK